MHQDFLNLILFEELVLIFFFDKKVVKKLFWGVEDLKIHLIRNVV